MCNRVNQEQSVEGASKQASLCPGRLGYCTAWVIGFLLTAMLSTAILSTAHADTIILKDGSVIEGEILRESSKYVKIKTKFGEKSYRRSKIEKIVKENSQESAMFSLRNVRDFSELTDLAQTLKNAQALYDLGRFDEIAPKIEPFLGKGTAIDDSRIKWLLIENLERKGDWATVDDMLDKMLKSQRESDKIRAKAHLDIFEENPKRNLRKIGGVRTKEFMTREMRNKAKVKNSLQDREIMNAALGEYLNQIVRSDNISVGAFARELDPRETDHVLREEITKDDKAKRKRNIEESLPYLDLLRKTEQSIYRAQAILPGYATGFELDLVRTEVTHLEQVIGGLLGTLSAAYPDDQNFSFAAEDGRLTAANREQWRAACDEFLALSRPISRLIEYLLKRARAFPEKLTPFIKQWEDTLERVQQMEHNTNRNYDRTRV
ncbi:MAG: hypothetical protein GXP29_07745 [Planctomycetes bacterium]|nr:hypothetical protein [Planctomycetota bacterium]